MRKAYPSLTRYGSRRKHCAYHPVCACNIVRSRRVDACTRAPHTVDLNTWNEKYLDGTTDKVTVMISHEGIGRYATTTLTFNLVAGNSGLDAVGIEKIAWNSGKKVLHATKAGPAVGRDRWTDLAYSVRQLVMQMGPI